MFYSSTMVFVCLIVFSEFFLGLFGKEFITGKYALIFLGVGYLINAIHGLAEHLLNISGNEKKLTVMHAEQRPGEVKHSCADITIAKNLLGYTPTIKFEDGLKELL